MTPKEFKAWFDGFTEAFDRLPTKAQWTRIKERVAEIDGRETTERVFVDRYWPVCYPQYVPYPAHYPYFSPFVGQHIVGGGGWSQNVASGLNTVDNGLASSVSNFSSTDAMFALGKTDALTLTA